MKLELAEKISSAAVALATKMKFAPVTVVVLDASGNTVVTKRMDGCAPVGIPQFAHAKANTCVVMKLPSSRAFRDKYTNDKDPAKFCQMLSMVSLTQGNGGMAPFPGGVLVIDDHKIVHGAIGVSGAAGDEDEACAYAGLEAARRTLSGEIDEVHID